MALSQLGKRMEGGDDSELVHWVIVEKLACSPRPLRHHPLYGGSRRNIAPEAAPLVREWALLIQCLGIKSIISLMHARELTYYEKLDLGAHSMIEFYKSQGFEVAHLPWEDPHHSSTSSDQVRTKLLAIRADALEKYDRLRKPVLIQCSAGIDRTAPLGGIHI